MDDAAKKSSEELACRLLEDMLQFYRNRLKEGSLKVGELQAMAELLKDNGINVDRTKKGDTMKALADALPFALDKLNN